MNAAAQVATCFLDHDEIVEADVPYRTEGHYHPQSETSPAEYPVVRVMDPIVVRIGSSEALHDFKQFPPGVQDRIFEQINEHIAEARE